MSSKKTHITDTENNKVFPETTIDQIFEPNGTDKFKVVQEFTEAEWEAKSDTEKAKIPLAKVLKKFIQRASNILYKNGKSVEKELDEINTNKADIPTYDAIASYGGGIYSSDTSFTMGKNGTALIQVANWTDDTLENISVKINTHSVATMTPNTRYKRETLTLPVRNGDVINFSGMSVGTLISINLM